MVSLVTSATYIKHITSKYKSIVELAEIRKKYVHVLSTHERNIRHVYMSDIVLSPFSKDIPDIFIKFAWSGWPTTLDVFLSWDKNTPTGLLSLLVQIGLLSLLVQIESRKLQSCEFLHLLAQLSIILFLFCDIEGQTQYWISYCLLLYNMESLSGICRGQSRDKE